MTTLREKKNYFPGLDYDWLPITPLTKHAKDEIVPGVWVGERGAARALHGAKGWTIIDVREADTTSARNVQNIALLRTKTHGLAGKKALGKIANAIDAGLRRGDRVLVHCWQGIERSPLAVAWWLCTRHSMALDDAYALLNRRRPGVRDCRDWLTLAAWDTVDPLPALPAAA